MNQKNLPFILIIISVILIILNIITTDYNSKGFWLRIASSVLLIIAMALVIKERNKGKLK